MWDQEKGEIKYQNHILGESFIHFEFLNYNIFGRYSGFSDARTVLGCLVLYVIAQNL
jgi:hypothetical protein